MDIMMSIHAEMTDLIPDPFEFLRVFVGDTVGYVVPSFEIQVATLLS